MCGRPGDIEHDAVTYRWSVVQQPAGATAQLETPDKPACRVTGMAVPGEYVLRLSVADPANTVTVGHTVPVFP